MSVLQFEHCAGFYVLLKPITKPIKDTYQGQQDEHNDKPSMSDINHEMNAGISILFYYLKLLYANELHFWSLHSDKMLRQCGHWKLDSNSNM